MSECPKCLAPLNSNGNCTFCDYQSNPPGFFRKWILPVIGLAVVYLGIGYYSAEVFVPSVDGMFSNMQPTSSAYTASVPAPEQTYDPQDYPQLSPAEVQELRSLFDTQQFTALNARFDELQAQLEANPLAEAPLLRGFDTFTLPDSNLLDNYDRWVATTPDHYAPYMARAEHFLAMATMNRKKAHTAEEPEEHLDLMHLFLYKAESELETALQINPRLLPAYLDMIVIHNLEEDETREYEAFESARLIYPASLALYTRILWARSPRWGGSYCKMESLASEALEHSESNPKLYTLFGIIYAGRAMRAHRNKDYGEALNYYSQGLTYGEGSLLYIGRAKTYYAMQNYPLAYADIERNLELNPTSIRSHIEARKILVKLGKTDDALYHVYLAALMAPEEDDLKESLDWATKTIKSSLHPQKTEMERVLANARAKHT